MNFISRAINKGVYLMCAVTAICAISVSSAKAEDGTRDGGGSFADEVAWNYLTTAVTNLSTHFKYVDEEKLSKILPPDWNLEKLRKLFILNKGVFLNQNYLFQRNNRVLLYDYCPEKNKRDSQVALSNECMKSKIQDPFLIATKVFVESLSTQAAVDPIVINTIELKLLHEACHLMGYGLTYGHDTEARDCAYRIQNAFIALPKVWNCNVSYKSKKIESISLPTRTVVLSEVADSPGIFGAKSIFLSAVSDGTVGEYLGNDFYGALVAQIEYDILKQVISIQLLHENYGSSKVLSSGELKKSGAGLGISASLKNKEPIAGLESATIVCEERK